MMKKPLCPHCRAIYTYREIQEQKNKEIIKCHNCKKDFVVNKVKGTIILFVLTFIIAIVFNILFLSYVGVRSVVPLIVMTAIIFTIAIFLKPFFVTYKKQQKEKK